MLSFAIWVLRLVGFLFAWGALQVVGRLLFALESGIYG